MLAVGADFPLRLFGTYDLFPRAKLTLGSIVGPDDGEVATLPLTFRWIDDSSEDHYELYVIDATGGVTWKSSVASNAGGEVSVSYTGAPLVSGETYQFRVTSLTDEGVPISQSEQLRGVFVAP